MRILAGLLTIGSYCLVSNASATPWGMAKNADIGMADGEVSICIPSAEKDEVAIESIWVAENEPLDGKSHTMWDVELKRGSNPEILKPGECAKYGSDLAAYQVNVSGQSLKVGVTYYFRLNRFMRNPSRTDVSFYDAVFCSVERDGKVFYLQYKYEDDGRVLKPQCGSK
ncbi:hypothetical protein ACQCLI_13775 [Pseudomonas nitroreducens]|uniref:hypothetical protein n=1 Tax=Pseudomonas nitroreducens TaxID=46680 RepID=UPI0012FE6F48|nr:hypothetical protein [Pseudomonas nitroreducens]